MKKLLGLCLIVIISLNLYGCACSKKNAKEIVTKCSLTSDQSTSGYKLETEYKVYSKKDIVTKVETKTTITSKKEKILKKFEKELNEQYETNNNNYGGYEYKVNLKDNSLTANVSIDYTKYDMKKFASDNVAIKEYLNKDKQFTLEGAKKYYNTIGAKCK